MQWNPKGEYCLAIDTLEPLWELGVAPPELGVLLGVDVTVVLFRFESLGLLRLGGEGISTTKVPNPS